MQKSTAKYSKITATVLCALLLGTQGLAQAAEDKSAAAAQQPAAQTQEISGDAVKEAIEKMGPMEDMLVYGRAAICYDTNMLQGVGVNPQPLQDDFARSYAVYLQKSMSGVLNEEQALSVGKALLERVQIADVIPFLVSVDGKEVAEKDAIETNERVGTENKAKTAQVRLTVYQFDRIAAVERAAQVFLANHPDTTAKPTPEQAPEFTELLCGSIRTARPVNRAEALIDCVYDEKLKHWRPANLEEFYKQVTPQLTMVKYVEAPEQK